MWEVNPGLIPGFGVLRCGPRVEKIHGFSCHSWTFFTFHKINAFFDLSIVSSSPLFHTMIKTKAFWYDYLNQLHFELSPVEFASHRADPRS
jgi:hypothetical protein